MAWQFDNNAPIYTQLVEQLKLKILSGEYPPGSKLDGVRELAAQAGVNPNTMQRALASLEETQLIYTQRTSGRFVTSNEALIDDVKIDLAQSRTQDYFENMTKLGFSYQETITFIDAYGKEILQ